MSDVEPREDRFETVLVVLVYVVPLTATVGLLAWLGLPGLALALLSVEAGISAAVLRAKQPEGRRWTPLVLLLLTVCAAAGTGGLVLLAGRV